MQGRRLVARVPYGHWKTMTFLAALRCDRIDAPCVFGRSTDFFNKIDPLRSFGDRWQTLAKKPDNIIDLAA